MIGILPVHKPAGITSHDAVFFVKRMINPAGTPKRDRIKVGHAGTLDPFANGVLLVTIGSATRLERYLHAHLKTYEATIHLGQSTTTDDPEGDVLESMPVPDLPNTLEHDLRTRFTGTIQQRPPIFSALKQGGEALYKKARRGEMIDVPTRPAFVSSLDVLDVNSDTLRIRVNVGSGTYIRALGRDIGEFLGTKAHLTALVRTSIGPWSLGECAELDQLTPASIVALSRFSGAHLGLAEIPLSHADVTEIRFGRPIELQNLSLSKDVTADDPMLGVHEQRPVAVLRRDQNALHPVIVL